VAFWLVPLVTIFPVVNWYNEFFEHYPFVATGTTDIEMSRNRWPGLVARILTCQLNEHLHQVHHLKPRVPFWNLPAAHETQLEDTTYRRLKMREVGLVLPVVSGIPSVVLNIVRLAGRRHHG
jgi:fatty acid desaturase